MVIEKIIPKGYKQTDVGMIPDDWEVKRMGKVATSVSSGKSKSKFAIGTYPVFGSTGIIGWSDQYDYQGNKILIARVGANAGTVNIVDGKYGVSDNTLIVSYDKNTDINFSYYQLISVRLNQLVFGSGQPLITGGQVKNLLVSLPPTKAEQTAISIALKDTNALISSLEEFISKKQNIKQGAMQELLTGKKRLPGFSGKWGIKKLGDVFLLSATCSKTKFIDEGGNYLIMDMGSVSSSGQMIASKKTFLSTDLLKIGDLVMPKDDIGGGNIIGKVAYINQGNKYVLGDHVYKLTVKTSEADTLFFSYLINSYVVNSKLRKKVAGSAQLGLGRKSVEEQDVKIPDEKTEQIAIAQVLNDMDVEIERLEQKLAKYKMLKQGMMQELLTGKTRLI